MEATDGNTLAVIRCARLRWKGLYVNVVPDPTVQPSNDRLLWCNRTQNCLGPDGQPVDEFECNAERPCYQIW